MYSVFIKVEGEWQKLAWDLSRKEAVDLVCSVVFLHDSIAEIRSQP